MVCMLFLFRKLCKQSSFFKTIDITLPHGYLDDAPYVNGITQLAVDRSSELLEDIYLESVCDDDTLLYIAERSKNLKHLRLGHHVNVSDKELVEALNLLSMLEELELIFCCLNSKTIEVVGLVWPSLKSFSLNDAYYENWKCDGDVKAIAKSMPNLRNLQLIGNSMTNEGLKAILDA